MQKIWFYRLLKNSPIFKKRWECNVVFVILKTKMIQQSQNNVRILVDEEIMKLVILKIQSSKTQKDVWKNSHILVYFIYPIKVRAGRSNATHMSHIIWPISYKLYYIIWAGWIPRNFKTFILKPKLSFFGESQKLNKDEFPHFYSPYIYDFFKFYR